MIIKEVTTHKEQEDAYHIRTVVFIQEQNVSPEEEMDKYDDEALHFIVYDGEIPIATSRLRFVESYGKLERICVLKEYRGKSIGKQLIHRMEQAILENDFQKAKLNGQTHAEKFYQQLGYETVSNEFLDAGIPHVTMVKQLS
ncbi:GNAT family N-acetyltransferase [Virgibacillus dokdonensis]|uniref:GNAT family N-acetyltransferase n=1 Tax=Virgibacillus dokdonensis TaxID=302167 RepID=A0A3E0WVS5_9BACI|nr:GNAT family N-acetyltransferase [Virgibacillus dokdonensis]RFA37082.1 GNAT family N-acetyltransferase [Virgibacillus dokdonensis]